MKCTEIHIGLSAFNNSYWKGIFYPEELAASKRFNFYCTRFNTYEINASFYKFPTVKGLKGWYDKSPANFLFSVKANRVITHFKKFNDCSQEIADFYATCREGLADKLGFVLFQLPPSFSYTPERLELILSSLDYSFRNVIEFRNITWWKPEVFDALAANNITFCSVSYPGLPEDVISTTSTVYVRLHGTPQLFYSGYETEQLVTLFETIQSKEGINKAYIYFNNTASNEGILNAMALQKEILGLPDS